MQTRREVRITVQKFPPFDDIQKKFKIAEGLFELAYKSKYFQLKSKNPQWSHEQIHEKVIELIDRGCSG